MQHRPTPTAAFNTTTITTDHIQQYLDENKAQILNILENQSTGKFSECAENQTRLHHNLMYLAAIADCQPKSSSTQLQQQQLQQMVPNSHMVAQSHSVPSATTLYNDTAATTTRVIEPAWHWQWDSGPTKWKWDQHGRIKIVNIGTIIKSTVISIYQMNSTKLCTGRASTDTLLEKFTVAEDMVAVQEEEEDDEMKLEKSKNLVKLPTTLASIESLTFPLIQEVVLMADFRCKMCQDRVANIVSKFNDKCFLFQDFLIFRWPVFFATVVQARDTTMASR
ncbi:unnamed protein product [Lactuca virosa]|uniref:SS18 N-terminal domain-containing protein n=1 Tax=Lactuca virosa TaxID=75947 RepID=A0AAU9PKT8_9ASTR|nr:unnamed protein product [Lactuca virosa]